MKAAAAYFAVFALALALFLFLPYACFRSATQVNVLLDEIAPTVELRVG